MSSSETAGCQPLRLASHCRIGDGQIVIQRLRPRRLLIYLVSLEQVMGIEPISNPWQGLIITIILYLYKLVGEVGADPTTPEGNGFTVRRSCRFATLPNKVTTKALSRSSRVILWSGWVTCLSSYHRWNLLNCTREWHAVIELNNYLEIRSFVFYPLN